MVMEEKMANKEISVKNRPARQESYEICSSIGSYRRLQKEGRIIHEHDKVDLSSHPF